MARWLLTWMGASLVGALLLGAVLALAAYGLTPALTGLATALGLTLGELGGLGLLTAILVGYGRLLRGPQPQSRRHCRRRR